MNNIPRTIFGSQVVAHTTLRLPALRRLAAGAMLCCFAATTAGTFFPTPVQAQESANAAALSFVNADIESVIKAIGHYTGMTFIIDPRVKGTITLVSEKSLSKTQAFGLLTSTLRLQGYAVVTSGDGYAKVVPEAEAKAQSSPTQVGGVRASKATGDQIATQVFYLSYESAANLTAVLRPLISPNNSIMANPGNNTLVITDYADNLRRLAKIIAALDTPVAADLDVVPIRNAIASDIAALVTRLMEPSAGGDSGRVTVLPDPRTNSVVVRAPSQARANLAKSLIARLDQQTSSQGNIHVVYLKNADASRVAQTLRAVVSQDASAVPVQQQGTSGGSIQAGSTTGGTGTGGLGGQQGQQGSTGMAGTGNTYGQQSQLTAGGGGGQGSGFIQADASTNSLIITAPDAVYRNLRSVIDQLDVRRAQVYIEALVVEVTSNKASEFGVQWIGASGDNDSKYRVGGIQSFTGGAQGSNIVNLAAAARNGLSGTAIPNVPGGLTFGLFRQVGGELGLGAVARALENDGNANILSTPNMITLDNELATIKVGQNVPIITGSYTTTAATGGGNPFQTVDRRDVGLLLKVRPQISEGGTIKMAIYHENSSVDPSTRNAASGLTTNVRAIESNVLADDGQIVVLGGLIEDTEGDGEEKVRGLGDIPLLGNLFKYRSRTRVKTNLMVFLRPVVVRSKEASNSLAMDRYEYMRAVGATGQASQEDTILMRNLGMPQLPPLTNGQPPVGGAMATAPVQAAPVAGSAPGAAIGQAVPDTQQRQQARPGAPSSSQPNSPSNSQPTSQFRPVTPSNQK
ncbi:type II secretion system secretin GspD [Massilia sp. UMI-21]|nr:type II secretion system secretin GspD [Massilia sp. UMI-21]